MGTGKNRIVHIARVYDKTSHIHDRKHGYPPVRSEGTYTNGHFNVVVHMTPELRRHPTERRILLRHEKREAKSLAKGKSIHYAHRQAASKDPRWLHGQKGFYEAWERLGHKNRTIFK